MRKIVMNCLKVASLTLLLAAGARADSVRQLPLLTRDLIYEPHSQRLYASVPSLAGASGNSIIAIDPTTGEVVRSVWVGSEPGKLAVSDDGRFLYVGLDGAAAVRRVDLPELIPGPRFSLRSDPLAGFEQVGDMAVLPGRPETVAVVTRYSSGRGSGSLTIYDHGVRLPQSLSGPGSPTQLVISSAGPPLYALDSLASTTIFQLAVDASGVSVAQAVPSAAGLGDYQLQEGLLYSSSGLIVDPELGTVTGQIPLVRHTSSPVGVADTAVGRMFFLSLEGDTPQLLAYDPRSLLLVGSTPVPGVSGPVRRLIRYGRDGIAFRTDGGSVFLVQTRLVPSGAFTVTIEPAAVQGTASAVGRIVLKQPAPAGGAVVALMSEQPERVQVPARVVVPGGLTSATFPVTSFAPTTSTAVPIDADLGGQSASTGLEVLSPPGAARRLPGGTTVRRVMLPARDLVYDRHTGRIYASIPSRIGGIGGSVAVLDPASGALVAFIPVGSEPGKLAISDDDRWLYVALDGAAAIRRIDLASQTAGPPFGVGVDPARGAYFVEDMAVAPGEPDLVAVSRYDLGYPPRHAGVVIYDRGVARVHQTPRVISNNRIEFGASAARLYGSDSENNGYTFSRMTVDAGGVTVQDVTRDLGLALYPGVDIRFDGGLIFTSAGVIFDAESRKKLGSFGVSDGSLVAPDLPAGRVFFLSPWGATRKDVLVFDPRTLALLGTVPIEDVFGDAGSLLRCGADELAFRLGQGSSVSDIDRIILVRSPLISGKRGADLAVTMAASPPAPRVGEALSYLVTVTNQGPDAATDVTLTDPLPAGTAFLSADAARGSCAVSRRVVTCLIGSLAPKESVTVTLVLKPLRPGLIANSVTVTSSAADPDPSNNRATSSVTAAPAFARRGGRTAEQRRR